MKIDPPGIKIFGAFIPTPIQQPKPEPEPAIPNLPGILESLGVPDNHNPTHFYSKRSLFECDVGKNHNRLTIPHNQILTTFLTDQEEHDLLMGARLDVKVIDPSLVVRDLNLSRWNYQQAAPKFKSAKRAPGYSYALNGGWMDIVKGNKLVPGNTVEVWSFRFGAESSLGFIIFKVDDKAVLDGSSSSSDANEGNKKDSCTISWGVKKRRGSNSSSCGSCYTS